MENEIIRRETIGNTHISFFNDNSIVISDVNDYWNSIPMSKKEVMKFIEIFNESII